jgi:hypothetical protein
MVQLKLLGRSRGIGVLLRPSSDLARQLLGLGGDGLREIRQGAVWFYDRGLWWVAAAVILRCTSSNIHSSPIGSCFSHSRHIFYHIPKLFCLLCAHELLWSWTNPLVLYVIIDVFCCCYFLCSSCLVL